ncbi:hypothetical protein KPH14_002606 [Odynerus spinipes]|uniref:Cytochrome P450 305a1 n=1 Tax=Odynerus spinipes TaxID=1348599 RepID=A0AAD9R8Q0_9HYME|nr:hypothetical protein KPH14_002606 [Odynerus spinipes]
MLSIILLTIIVILLVILAENSRRWNRKNLPPGPFPWPFIGNQSLLRRLTREMGCQHLAFWELARRYRSDLIMLRLGAHDVVVVSGNKAVQKLLNSDDFTGRPWNEFIKLRNMGVRKGITMSDGPEWKDVRSWVIRTLRTLGFGKRKMSDLINDELVQILENLKDGGVKRMKPLIAPAVINVLWTLTTGKRLHEGSRLQYFNELMERRTRVFDMVGGVLSTFPWIRYIAPETSGYNLLVTVNNELKSFLMEAINDHKKKYVPGSETDLIDMFLDEMYNEKGSKSVFTDDQLVMILLDLFIAGLTTTATSLDFLLLHMIVYQDVQRKVKEEIATNIGSDKLPELEDKSKLPYTEAVITEVQRMWAVTPIIGPRRTFEDTSLESYSIPKDTPILVNLYSVHMDPELFPNPCEFKPERFLKNGIYQPDENVLAFGKGKRRCPGEALARSALFLIFIGIMQKYTLLPVPNQGPTIVEAIPGLTLSPKEYEVYRVGNNLLQINIHEYRS